MSLYNSSIQIDLYIFVALKTMPVFGSDGFIFILTDLPVCNPIPLMDNELFTVF